MLIQKISESAIVDNLRKRFMEDCIYVSEQTALSGDDNRTSLSRQLVECFSSFDPENTLKPNRFHPSLPDLDLCPPRSWTKINQNAKSLDQRLLHSKAIKIIVQTHQRNRYSTHRLLYMDYYYSA